MKVPDGVRLMTLTTEKALSVWNKLQEYTSRFGEDDFRNLNMFLERFYAKDSQIFELPFGIVFLEHILPGHRAEVHVSFWDHKLSEHTELLRDCLLWAFLTFDLHRIETFVDAKAKAVRRFLEKRMGFTHEGVMRERLKLHGEYIDVHVFGILREEVLGGNDGCE